MLLDHCLVSGFVVVSYLMILRRFVLEVLTSLTILARRVQELRGMVEVAMVLVRDELRIRMRSRSSRIRCHQTWACASLHGSMAETRLSHSADILREMLHLHQLAA